MYYLLEDKIKIYESSRSIGEINGKLFEAYHLFPDKEDIAYLGKIKKQSENVFDLIEIGDLVAQKKIFGYEEIYNVSLVCGKDDKLIKCFNCTMFEDKVVAIYKPNSNGDYIKVWEKKMEV